MTTPPNKEDTLRDYDSGDDSSEFEGSSDVESDISIPEEPSSEEESGEESDSKPENATEWTDTLRAVHVEQFNGDTGPVFSDDFDVQTATPKDYFDLMFSPDIISDFVRHTNNYAQWKMEQKGKEDSVWSKSKMTEPEMRAYLGLKAGVDLDFLPPGRQLSL